MHASARALTPWRSEFRIRLPGNNGWKWLSAAATPRRTSDGDTLWHGVITDVTETRLAQEELRRARSLLEGILQGMADIVVARDREGRTTGSIEVTRDITGQVRMAQRERERQATPGNGDPPAD